MPSIFENTKALVQQYRRDSARAYLTSAAQRHVQEFPQLCCYSFDDIAIEVNIDGRADRYALAALAEIVGERTAGRTILDVGANIGNHALMFAGMADQVIAFEPHPVTFQLLKLNARDHGNIVPVNFGASDNQAELLAVSPKRNRGATSISLRAAQAGEDSWTFTVATLDSVPAVQTADVALMKLDVEGHEVAALLGAAAMIQKNRPIIVAEQNAAAIADGSSEALRVLEDFGYVFFYSIDVDIAWRTAQTLPTPLRRAGRILESLIFGPAPFAATVKPVNRLEKRDYPMLLAAFEPLEIAPKAGGAD